jgi:hypothetical protein
MVASPPKDPPPAAPEKAADKSAAEKAREAQAAKDAKKAAEDQKAAQEKAAAEEKARKQYEEEQQAASSKRRSVLPWLFGAGGLGIGALLGGAAAIPIGLAALAIGFLMAQFGLFDSGLGKWLGGLFGAGGPKTPQKTSGETGGEDQHKRKAPAFPTPQKQKKPGFGDLSDDDWLKGGPLTLAELGLLAGAGRLGQKLIYRNPADRAERAAKDAEKALEKAREANRKLKEATREMEEARQRMEEARRQMEEARRKLEEAKELKDRAEREQKTREAQRELEEARQRFEKAQKEFEAAREKARQAIEEQAKAQKAVEKAENIAEEANRNPGRTLRGKKLAPRVKEALEKTKELADQAREAAREAEKLKLEAERLKLEAEKLKLEKLKIDLDAARQEGKPDPNAAKKLADQQAKVDRATERLRKQQVRTDELGRQAEARARSKARAEAGQLPEDIQIGKKTYRFDKTKSGELLLREVRPNGELGEIALRERYSGRLEFEQRWFGRDKWRGMETPAAKRLRARLRKMALEDPLEFRNLYDLINGDKGVYGRKVLDLLEEMKPIADKALPSSPRTPAKTTAPEDTRLPPEPPRPDIDPADLVLREQPRSRLSHDLVLERPPEEQGNNLDLRTQSRSQGRDLPLRLEGDPIPENGKDMPLRRTPKNQGKDLLLENPPADQGEELLLEKTPGEQGKDLELRNQPKKQGRALPLRRDGDAVPENGEDLALKEPPKKQGEELLLEKTPGEQGKYMPLEQLPEEQGRELPLRKEGEAIPENGEDLPLREQRKNQGEDLVLEEPTKDQGKELELRHQPKKQGRELPLRREGDATPENGEDLPLREQPKDQGKDLVLEEPAKDQGKELELKETPKDQGRELELKAQPENDLPLRQKGTEALKNGENLPLREQPKNQGEDLVLEEVPKKQGKELELRHQPKKQGRELPLRKEGDAVPENGEDLPLRKQQADQGKNLLLDQLPKDQGKDLELQAQPENDLPLRQKGTEAPKNGEDLPLRRQQTDQGKDLVLEEPAKDQGKNLELKETPKDQGNDLELRRQPKKQGRELPLREKGTEAPKNGEDLPLRQQPKKQGEDLVLEEAKPDPNLELKLQPENDLPLKLDPNRPTDYDAALDAARANKIEVPHDCLTRRLQQGPQADAGLAREGQQVVGKAGTTTSQPKGNSTTTGERFGSAGETAPGLAMAAALWYFTYTKTPNTAEEAVALEREKWLVNTFGGAQVSSTFGHFLNPRSVPFWPKAPLANAISGLDTGLNAGKAGATVLDEAAVLPTASEMATTATEATKTTETAAKVAEEATMLTRAGSVLKIPGYACGPLMTGLGVYQMANAGNDFDRHEGAVVTVVGAGETIVTVGNLTVGSEAVAASPILGELAAVTPLAGAMLAGWFIGNAYAKWQYGETLPEALEHARDAIKKCEQNLTVTYAPSPSSHRYATRAVFGPAVAPAANDYRHSYEAAQAFLALTPWGVLKKMLPQDVAAMDEGTARDQKAKQAIMNAMAHDPKRWSQHMKDAVTTEAKTLQSELNNDYKMGNGKLQKFVNEALSGTSDPSCWGTYYYDMEKGLARVIDPKSVVDHLWGEDDLRKIQDDPRLKSLHRLRAFIACYNELAGDAGRYKQSGENKALWHSMDQRLKAHLHFLGRIKKETYKGSSYGDDLYEDDTRAAIARATDEIEALVKSGKVTKQARRMFPQLHGRGDTLSATEKGHLSDLAKRIRKHFVNHDEWLAALQEAVAEQAMYKPHKLNVLLNERIRAQLETMRLLTPEQQKNMLEAHAKIQHDFGKSAPGLRALFASEKEINVVLRSIIVSADKKKKGESRDEDSDEDSPRHPEPLTAEKLKAVEEKKVAGLAIALGIYLPLHTKYWDEVNGVLKKLTTKTQLVRGKLTDKADSVAREMSEARREFRESFLSIMKMWKNTPTKDLITHLRWTDGAHPELTGKDYRDRNVSVALSNIQKKAAYAGVALPDELSKAVEAALKPSAEMKAGTKAGPDSWAPGGTMIPSAETLAALPQLTGVNLGFGDLGTMTSPQFHSWEESTLDGGLPFL